MARTLPSQPDLTPSANGFQAPSRQLAVETLLANWKVGRLWHAEAPASLKRDWKSLDEAKAWKRWVAYLAKRKSPSRLTKLAHGYNNPLEWGLPVSADGDEVIAWRVKLQQQLHRAGDFPTPQLRETLDQLFAEASDGPLSRGTALRLLALAYLLPELAGPLGMEFWWEVVHRLTTLVQKFQTGSFDEFSASDLLLVTLVGGELPLVLCVIFPELKPLRDLRSAARRLLGEGLLAATDGEGIPAARLLPTLPLLFSTWTRCRALTDGLPKGCWSSEAEVQYSWLVRQTILLTRADGAPVLTTDRVRSWPAGPMDVALDVVGDDSDHAAANARLARHLRTTDGEYDTDDLPPASIDSEWSEINLLSSSLTSSASRLLVDYSAPTLRIEVEAHGKLLMAGDLAIETTLQGKPLTPEGEWEQQCWFSDEESDYLDLTIDLTGGATLERQIMLGKEDGFLLLHDILHADGDEPGEWQHNIHFPLAEGVAYAPEAETRDGVLLNKKGRPLASLLPLALPEWRIEARVGELTSAPGRLTLTHRALARRISSPLWIDLRAKRATKPRTWRQLTVAQSLEKVGRDVAVGYRIQTASSQWLVYRALDRPANRTVLGQNTAAETLIGRFLRSGEFDTMVEVDPE